MTAEIEKRIMELSRGERLDYDRDETFVDMFLRHSEERSGKTAVADVDGKISYGELALYTKVVANRLVELGVKPNDFVLVKMPRCKEFMIAVIGVLRAGACYVPVDPEYPADRIDYMIADCGAKVTIDVDWLLALKKHYGIKALALPKINLATPDGLAYMLYTSGSTGRPKGVMLPHKALRAFIAWQIKRFDLKPGFRAAEHCSFCFDLSVMDLCGTLAAGGEVHVIHEEIRKDLDAVNEFLKERKIEGMVLGTQFGTELLNNCEVPLRYVLLCGEKLLPFRKQRPDLEVVNLYGPTEFTIGCSAHIVDLDKDAANIPIGRPHPNTWNFIVDKDMKLLPPGEVGELCLAGAQMGAGYWNQPEKTKAAFVDCPFLPGEKMYRTGDLAKWNEDGELLCLGRIDHQVKIRGFRIELGEIENVAKSFAGVGMVAAAAKEVGGIKHLVLYYTVESAVEKSALKSHLEKSLAYYMIPEAFVELREMPMTPNGKIDRKRLPDPEIGRTVEYVEPAGDRERLVAEAFKEVLSLPAEVKVGALDSFFALGGESLKAIRLVSMLKKRGHVVTVADVLRFNTVRELASVKGEATKEERELMDETKKWDFAKWGEDAKKRTIEHYAAQGMEIERAYPVVGLQEVMTMATDDDTARQGFTELLMYRLDVVPRAVHVRRALDRLAERHEAFRTAIIYRNLDDPLQIVLKGRKIEFSLKKFVSLEKAMKDAISVPFDLEEDSLARLQMFKLKEGGCILLFSLSHAIFDGCCVQTFIGDFRRYLSDEMRTHRGFAGRIQRLWRRIFPDALVPERVKPFRYCKFVCDITSRDTAPAMEYWGKLLDGFTKKSVIPSAGADIPPEKRAVDNMLTISLTAEETSRLQKVASESRATLNAAVEYAWGKALQDFNRTDDVLFTKVVARRDLADDDTRDAMGLYMGVIAIRVKSPAGETARDGLAALQRQIAESAAYEYCSEYALASVSSLGMESFESLMVSSDYGDETGGDIPGAIRFHQIKTPISAGNQLELHPHVDADGLKVDFVFDTAKYTTDEIRFAAEGLNRRLLWISA